MKLALQLVGLICLGSAAIHLVTGFRTEFAFSMIGVAVCAIGVGYIDYSRRRNHGRREEVWARRDECGWPMCSFQPHECPEARRTAS